MNDPIPFLNELIRSHKIARVIIPCNHLKWSASILEGNDIFVEFKGALTEQYVLQELVSETSYTPYYYGTNSQTFEMDFMIQKGRDIVPIEVKSEVSTQAKSLKLYCKKFGPHYAVRFSMLDYIEQENLTNIPLYAVCNV